MTAGEALPPVAFVVAGRLEQRTGGYLYDARMVAGLRELGRTVDVVELAGAWPRPDATARSALSSALAALRDGSTVVVDGLVGGAAPDPIEAEAGRLGIVALVHHPLADEGGGGTAESARLEALETRTLAAASGVIVTSRFTRERVSDMGTDPARIRVVEPGTDGPAREGAGEVARDGGRPGPVRLLCLGSVVPRKNQGGLLEALEGVYEIDPQIDWRCDVVGSLDRDPAYAEAVLEATAASPVAARMEFTGELDDEGLSRRWQRADVFVSPSRYEGYGMALAEAMSRGLPVIAAAGGAVARTVPARVGELVPPGDTPALASALRRILSDPARRREMARRSRCHAASLPGWDAQAAAFDAALRELVRG